MVNIDILDEADGYPYSSHISVEGYEIEIGDLFLVFESAKESTVRVAEQVYGFTWGSVITYPINRGVRAEVHDIDRLSNDLGARKITVAPKRHQTSFYTDDETVRRLALYYNYYNNGRQPILIDETRNALSTEFNSQEVSFYENVGGVIDHLYRTPPSTAHEAEQIRTFLLDVGVKKNKLLSADNHTIEGYDE